MDLSSVFSYSTQSWSSDSDIYNISSPESVSPSHCLDFSPVSRTQDSPVMSRSDIPESRVSGGRMRTRTRTRSKNPSKQRQNASEKEKLRMRDLTKALHHLRSFLPPSVAPTGQTLTKIETLRLTISYITFLSSQLGLEEPLSQSSDPRDPHTELHHYSSGPQAWRPAHTAQTHTHTHTHSPGHEAHYSPAQRGMDVDILSMLECPLYTNTFTYQDCNKAVHYEPPTFWS